MRSRVHCRRGVAVALAVFSVCRISVAIEPPNEEPPKPAEPICDWALDGLFHLALEEEHGRMVVVSGADVNKTDPCGRTALFGAAAWGMTDGIFGRGQAAFALVDAGAKVNVKTAIGETPLMTTARFANTSALKVLIDAGADVNARDDCDWSALMYAVVAGDWFGCRMAIRTNEGKTTDAKVDLEYFGIGMCLQYTICQPSVALLLASHADIDARTSDGWTPLMLAATAGWYDAKRSAPAHMPVVLEQIEDLQKGLNEQPTGDLSFIPSRAFADHDVRQLLEAGARLDLRNKDGDTALDLALRRDDEPGKTIVRLIRAAESSRAEQKQPKTKGD